MFQSKRYQNSGHFTPLMQCEGAEEGENEINHNQVGINNSNSTTNNEFATAGPSADPDMYSKKKRKKLEKYQEKQCRISLERRKKRIFELDATEAVKRPEDWRYYIISLIVPLIVFIFALVVLCFFIILPITQGLNAANGNSDGSGKSQSESIPAHTHSGHEPIQAVKPAAIDTNQGTNSSSSVKKDGDNDDHHEHHHHD